MGIARFLKIESSLIEERMCHKRHRIQPITRGHDGGAPGANCVPVSPSYPENIVPHKLQDLALSSPILVEVSCG
jgi:hypothetical protein